MGVSSRENPPGFSKEAQRQSGATHVAGSHEYVLWWRRRPGASAASVEEPPSGASSGACCSRRASRACKFRAIFRRWAMLCRYAARFCWESSGSDAGAHDALATRAIHNSEIAACLAAIVTNGACEGGGKARVRVGVGSYVVQICKSITRSSFSRCEVTILYITRGTPDANSTPGRK